jgi:hypothetical protein
MSFVINPFAFATGGNAWTPADMSTLFWYDAADTSTISDNNIPGFVNAMADKSGNNYGLTASTAANSVGTGSRTLNGLNVLDFPATSGAWLQNPSFSYNQAATPLYIAAVTQLDVATGAPAILAGRSSTAVGQRMVMRAAGTPIGWQILGSDGVSNVTFGGGLLTASQPYILLPKFNYSTSVWRVNGTQTNTGNIGTNAFTQLRLGANEQGSTLMDGFIGEVVGFSDGTQQEKIEGYLAWKWGQQGNLPANHPYKNEPPTT